MIGLATGMGILAGVAFGAWGALAFLAGAVAFCALVRSCPSAAAICIVTLLTALGVWRHTTAGTDPPLNNRHSPDLSKLVIVSNPDSDGSFQQFVASPVDDPSTRLCISARSLPVVAPGDRIAVQGSPGRPQDDALDVQRFLASRGCAASLFARSLQIAGSGSTGRFTFGRIRAAVSSTLRNLAPGDSGALLAGLVVGDDSALSTDREIAFTNSGTTHLTAVSGSNLALIAGMLIAFGRATVGQHRLPWQIVTIAGIWAFALVSGAEPPSVRAAIVAGVALVAVRFGRTADFPSLILMAAGVMALLDPAQVTRIGFQLSIAASLALALVIPAFAHRTVSGTISGVIAATAVAQLATLPILLAAFGRLTAFSIPANALVAPLAGIAMPLAGLAAMMGIANPWLGEMAVGPATVAAEMIIGIVDLLGSASAAVVVGIPPAPSVFLLAATSATLVWVLSLHR